jgi:shikimate dehydrogenase
MSVPARSIDGDTRLVAIIADPIAQVKSPALFNAYFHRHDINAVLIPAHVAPMDLTAAMAGLRSLRNLAGVVVTVPHKMPAAKLAARLSPRAAITGAVNCLRVGDDGQWEGDNFDGAGFVKGIEDRGHAVAGMHVLLVGAAGGAGSALAHALCEAGIARLEVHDVASDALATLNRKLQSRFSGVEVASTEPIARPEHRLVINASPMGMRVTDTCPVDIGDAAADAVIADLIMKPECTELLARAERQGLRTHAGRYLLESSVEEIAKFFRLEARIS